MSDQGPWSDQGTWIERPVKRTGIVVWVLTAAAVAVAIALVNEPSRAWIHAQPGWLLVILIVILLVLGAMWLADRRQEESASAATGVEVTKRALIFLLVVVPLVAMGTASVFFWMPAAGQLITLRSVILVVLVITPALMWWLFLATKRASLLNEFLANLQRLGLLDALTPGNQAEGETARNTRVKSYLQRFEAMYGELSQQIHNDVREGTFRPYSKAEASESVPLATQAIPVALAVVVMAVGWVITLPPIDTFPVDPTQPRWLLALSPNPTPATFAFLGAYFFSIQMLFRRYVRADLRGNAFVAMVMRILLAVIGVWVITSVGKVAGVQSKPQMLLLAFVIGVFPMVAWQVIRGAMSKLFSWSVPSLQSEMQLNLLDGLTVWHETRLEEEDIENVHNMATADIVDLMVDTRIPVGRLIDWIDQAILLTYLGPDGAKNDDPNSARRRLAWHGIRTATSLLMVNSTKRGPDHTSFARLLVDNEGRPAIPSLISAIQTNDNLERVLQWRGLKPLTKPHLAHSSNGNGRRKTDRLTLHNKAPGVKV